MAKSPIKKDTLMESIAEGEKTLDKMQKKVLDQVLLVLARDIDKARADSNAKINEIELMCENFRKEISQLELIVGRIKDRMGL